MGNWARVRCFTVKS